MVTERDVYPVPHIEECLTTLAGQKVFSLLDLCSGYWQIPISEKDKHKTAFTTRGGLFEWNRLPFGLSNAPATFQRDVLQRLSDAHLFIRMNKGQYAQKELLYLGHRISGEGIATSLSHVEAVSKFPTPKTPADVQQFIGLVGFSRRFIRDFASKSRPLVELYKKDSVFIWEEPQQRAFQELKRAMVEAPILGFPVRKEPFCIESDASGIGPVVLAPKKDGTLRFCVNYRKLNMVTERDVYPLPHIEECLTTLAGQKVFSLLDLCSGYWQIPISEKDKHKTAFTTRGGLFEWNRLPFGLSNAPATFQRAMDLILRGLLWEECLVYIDDILIFGRDMPEHNRRLIHVLQRLSDAHLFIRMNKGQYSN
ncbi:Gag-pol fusion protein [Pelomyxa schiedti]|nr:Gag-pol fusion protein [Pelomyxa schiedti]